MCDICDEYLDENGKIKPGKITDFHKAEQELGFRILRNAWWGVSDTFFCFKLTCSFQPFPKPLLISLLLSSPLPVQASRDTDTGSHVSTTVLDAPFSDWLVGETYYEVNCLPLQKNIAARRPKEG
jgi:hypothetical protein